MYITAAAATVSLFLLLSATSLPLQAQSEVSEKSAQAAAQRIAEHMMATLPHCLKLGASAWNSKLTNAGAYKYGLVVNVIQPSCSAEQAGLRVGDMIVRFHGKALSQAANLPQLVSTDQQSGVELHYIRTGEGLRTAQVTYASNRPVQNSQRRQAMLLSDEQLTAQCEILFGYFTGRKSLDPSSLTSFAACGPAKSPAYWFYDAEIKYEQAKQARTAGQQDKASELMQAASKSYGVADDYGKSGAQKRAADVLVESESFQRVEGLESRKIQDARLLYQDASGKYYGAIVTHRNGRPRQANLYEQELKIFVERIPDANGVFFNASPAKAKPQKEAPAQDGLNYGEDEIARIANHVLPNIDRVFPEWRAHPMWKHYKDRVIVEFYIQGLHLKTTRDFDYSDTAEDAVFWMWLKRQGGGGTWRPAYEVDGLLGHAETVERITVASVLEHRKRVDDGVSDDRKMILAMFDRHKTATAKIQTDLQNAYARKLVSDRRSGIVYKPGSYWKQYANFDTPRNTIEGNFHFIEHPAEFAEAYLTYVYQYYEVCEPHLPAGRKSYTATWFETRYGVTSQTSSSYVEMAPRFATAFEKMGDIKYKKDTSAFLMSIVNSMGEVEGRNPFSFIGETLTGLAKDLVTDRETARFLRTEGCTSPIVRQYGENLWRSANGRSSAQRAGVSFPGADAASADYERADVRRFMDETIAARARNPAPKEQGYAYYDENLVAYRTGMGMANDGRRQVPAMRTVGLELEKRGYPVLYCNYGPTGFYDNGEYKTLSYAFWYEQKPAELDRLLAARTKETDVYKGMKYAISVCPTNSLDALAIINGK